MARVHSLSRRAVSVAGCAALVIIAMFGYVITGMPDETHTTSGGRSTLSRPSEPVARTAAISSLLTTGSASAQPKKSGDDDATQRPVAASPLTVVAGLRPVVSVDGFMGGKNDCYKTPDFPVSELEKEIKRLYDVVEVVMRRMNATYWPTDGTVIGMARTGRIATDRDVDLQIHATYAECGRVLHSLRDHFAKVADIKSFKVVYTRHPKYGKIGRYAMVRLFRKFGSFDTGPDFNCVYTDDPSGKYTFHVHSGKLVPVPDSVFPLGRCALYDRVVPCPREANALLDAFAPKYPGCMVFPHCVGKPSVSVRECLSPYPDVPLQSLVDEAKKLHDCGFTSFWEHFHKEPACKRVLSGATRRCKKVAGGEDICFYQEYH